MRTLVVGLLALAACGGPAFSSAGGPSSDPALIDPAAASADPTATATAAPDDDGAAPEAAATMAHHLVLEAGAPTGDAQATPDAQPPRPEAGEPVEAAAPECTPATSADGGLAYSCGGALVTVQRTCYQTSDPSCGLGGNGVELPSPWVWCGNPTTLPCMTKGPTGCCQIKPSP